MIVWINGPFGVGKTTAARLIASRTGGRLFDPEHVGYLVAAHFADVDFDDFQDLPAWRTLVPAVAVVLGRETGSDLVAVQTVLVEQYWDELMDGLEGRGIEVHHVVLDCAGAELRRRIEADEVEAQARQWRLDQVDAFERARSWLGHSAGATIDTTTLSPDAVAQAVVDSIPPS